MQLRAVFLTIEVRSVGRGDAMRVSRLLAVVIRVQSQVCLLHGLSSEGAVVATTFSSICVRLLAGAFSKTTIVLAARLPS